MPIQNLSVLRGMGRHPQHLRIFFTGHAGVPHGAVEIAGIAAVEQDGLVKISVYGDLAGQHINKLFALMLQERRKFPQAARLDAGEQRHEALVAQIGTQRHREVDVLLLAPSASSNSLIW